MKKVLIVSTLGLFLAGCLTNGMSTQQGAGTLIGAAAGGLMGSKFGKGNGRLAATAVGTAVGALAGNMITQPHDCNAVARQDQGYAPEYYPYPPQPAYYPPQPQYYPQPPRRQVRAKAPRRAAVQHQHHHYHQPAYPADWY